MDAPETLSAADFRARAGKAGRRVTLGVRLPKPALAANRGVVISRPFVRIHSGSRSAPAAAR